MTVMIEGSTLDTVAQAIYAVLYPNTRPWDEGRRLSRVRCRRAALAAIRALGAEGG